MSVGEMVPIVQVARSLGIPVDLVRSRIEGGQLSTVRDEGGQWLVEHPLVADSAPDDGPELDLRAGDEPAVIPVQSDVLAAQAAVLLAKTQAAAARFQSQDFFRRLRAANDAAAADRQARDEADQALALAEQSLQDMRRDQAVAEAKVQELRKQLANDDRHFQFMVDRIASLEWERQRLTRSLGWWGRVRYRRMVQNPPAATTSPEPEPLVPSTPGVEESAPHQAARHRYPPPRTTDKVGGGAADALATVQNLEPLS